MKLVFLFFICLFIYFFLSLNHALLIFIFPFFLLVSLPLQSIDKLQKKLRSEGGIKALLGIVRCGHPDVLSQVARGIANFAKCESRGSTQGMSLNLFIYFGRYGASFIQHKSLLSPLFFMHLELLVSSCCL